MNKGPISQFIEKHFLHFNAAALVDAAKGYETHLQDACGTSRCDEYSRARDFLG